MPLNLFLHIQSYYIQKMGFFKGFFMAGLRSSPAIDSFLHPLTRRRASCKIVLKILWGEPFEPGTDRAAALRPSAGPIRLDRDGRAGIFRAHPPRL